MASVSAPDALDASPELNLLLEWPQRRPFWSWAAIVAIASLIQAAFFLALLSMAELPVPHTTERVVILHKTPLYVPRDLLTQRAPNRQRPAENVKLSDLLPSQATPARRPTPPASAKHFEIPKTTTVAKSEVPPRLQAPPNITPRDEPAHPPPGVANGLPVPAPPAPQETKADQPFQDIGPDSAPLNPHPSLHVPKPTADGAIQSLAQTPNARHLIVTDQSFSPRPLPGSPGSGAHTGPSQHVEVELKSDADAPDFRAYLARILAVVRGNWRLVTPESVRMGTLRGQNTIELIIERNGNIPKLVIGQSSNNPALDQASVAGVSMSNPLPPLPADFKGEQARLAFTFKYNVQE